MSAVVALALIGVSSPRQGLIAAPDPAPAPADLQEDLDSPTVSQPGRPLPRATPVVGEPTPVLLDVPIANAAAPAVPDAQLAIRTYEVEPGDSVRSIAQRFSVTNETIIWENDLTDPDVLRVGQELHILPFSGLIHEVRPGDTVASVANSYDALVRDVVAANRLSDPFVIVVGQKLAVPGGYRPLPRKVVVSPERTGDTVQAPPSNDDQQAAIVTSVPRHTLPTLGGTPQEQFIGSIADAAVESADATGVPASVTIAQAILESYWGSSRLAREANNYFGIKAQTRGGSAGSVWFDVWEVIGGRNIMQSQAFRAYKTAAESFVDHGLFFVENGRYAGAMAAKTNPRQFAREVNRAGYATDPAYASKLIGLMDRYDLYRYDEV
ncbi:MAG: glucosaminidase domain-containing protein [Chloroflexota bacterium]